MRFDCLKVWCWKNLSESLRSSFSALKIYAPKNKSSGCLGGSISSIGSKSLDQPNNHKPQTTNQKQQTFPCITKSTNYRILNTLSGTYTIVLGAGEYGQDVTFYCENKVGDIIIEPDTGITINAAGTISFNDIGSTVTLRYMRDSIGVGAWYVISDYEVTYN